MLGQLIVARFSGPRPSAAFLRRIRLGQVGGVILLADNVARSDRATLAMTRALQVTARAGGNPPLLIMTDQEGGAIRRVPGPPIVNAAEMGTTAFAQGRAAGALLHSVGINMDLAPVADVERHGSFLGARSFGTSATTVADESCAFARGLSAAHVGYTLKHFPGLGLATANTDYGPVSIPAPASTVRAGYLPYADCGSSPMAMVMVSNAVYPSLTGPLPAVVSPLTYQRELRMAAPHGDPPTISDDLQAGALAGQHSPARAAINAGLDMAMYARTEAGSAAAYGHLTRALADGRISRARLRAAVGAVLRLKQAIAGH